MVRRDSGAFVLRNFRLRNSPVRSFSVPFTFLRLRCLRSPLTRSPVLFRPIRRRAEPDGFQSGRWRASPIITAAPFAGPLIASWRASSRRRGRSFTRMEPPPHSLPRSDSAGCRAPNSSLFSGGDGRIHPVSVAWIEYQETCKTSRIQARAATADDSAAARGGIYWRSTLSFMPRSEEN